MPFVRAYVRPFTVDRSVDRSTGHNQSVVCWFDRSLVFWFVYSLLSFLRCGGLPRFVQSLACTAWQFLSIYIYYSIPSAIVLSLH